MEPHNFLQNLDNKEIYNTLRMPIDKKTTPENNNLNKNNNKNNNDDIHFIASKELRLPLFMQDISYDNKNNK